MLQSCITQVLQMSFTQIASRTTKSDHRNGEKGAERHTRSNQQRSGHFTLFFTLKSFMQTSPAARRLPEEKSDRHNFHHPLNIKDRDAFYVFLFCFVTLEQKRSLTRTKMHHRKSSPLKQSSSPSCGTTQLPPSVRPVSPNYSLKIYFSSAKHETLMIPMWRQPGGLWMRWKQDVESRVHAGRRVGGGSRRCL